MVSPRRVDTAVDLRLEALEAELPRLADAMVRNIRARVSEYRFDPTGAVHAEVFGAVRTAVLGFVETGGRGPVRAELEDTARRLGRLTAEAGRSAEAQQAAYRIATQQVTAWLHEREAARGMRREDRVDLEGRVAAFTGELARLSAEGFADARRQRDGLLELRDRLLGLLLRPHETPRRALAEMAGRVGWTLPDTVRVLEFTPEGPFDADLLADITRHAGPTGMVGRVANRTVVLLDAATDLTGLRAALPPGTTLVVGPAVPLADARISARVAYRAARRGVRGVAQADAVCCEDQLLDLLGRGAEEVMGLLAASRLQPLAQLSLVKRVKLGRLLSAWLEHGTLHADVPGVLDKSRHTLHYQTTQLETLFGDALTDRDSRVELILALRAALPQWEIELSALERRRGRRTGASRAVGANSLSLREFCD